MNEIEIQPSGPLSAKIRPPGSKSITNRALVCAALAKGESFLTGALDSEDTRVMVEALVALGIQVQPDWQEATLRVSGEGGNIPAKNATLYVANSGTTVRFLTALVALGHGEFLLDGTPRMRERPIGDLLAALRQIGVEAEALSPGECPPVKISANGLAGGEATVRGDVSSQFLSGLLLAAPCAEKPLKLRITGELVSKPYVEMTLAVMKTFGVQVETRGLSEFTVPTGAYQPREFAIEPDASAASYFFAAAAIVGGTVTVEGLSTNSLQGDVAFVDLLEQMGCRVERGANSITVTGGPLRGISCDMNAISDTVQTLAAVALFAEGPTTVTNVAHIRHKETDRIGALATELRKFGALVEERADGLRIEPRPLRAASIATYDDHRMAMSLSLPGLRLPGVRIQNPACAGKTYPRFFEDLSKIANA